MRPQVNVDALDQAVAALPDKAARRSSDAHILDAPEWVRQINSPPGNRRPIVRRD
jgi:hypothetical protein